MVGHSLHPHRAVGEHQVPLVDLGRSGLAGAHPDHRVGAALVKLLHSNGHRGPTHAGGSNGYPLPLQEAGEGLIFPEIGHLLRVFQIGGQPNRPLGTARHEHIAAHLSRAEAHMHHSFRHVVPPYRSALARSSRMMDRSPLTATSMARRSQSLG